MKLALIAATLNAIINAHFAVAGITNLVDLFSWNTDNEPEILEIAETKYAAIRRTASEAYNYCGEEDLISVEDQLAGTSTEPINMPMDSLWKWQRFVECMPSLIEYCSALKTVDPQAGSIEFALNIQNSEAVTVLSEIHSEKCDVRLRIDRPNDVSVNWEEELIKWKKIVKEFDVITLSLPDLKDLSVNEFREVVGIIKATHHLETLKVGELSGDRERKLIDFVRTNLFDLSKLEIGGNLVFSGISDDS